MAGGFPGCYWLYHMELKDGRLLCWYDASEGEGNEARQVTYSLDGAPLEKK